MALLFQVDLAAAEPSKLWQQLTPLQHEALAPLASQWNSLPYKLQRHLLRAASYYRQLTPNQKLRFQNRLDKWIKLTPEQRDRARQKFLAFRKVRPDIREQVVKMAHDQENNTPAASGVEFTKSAP